MDNRVSESWGSEAGKLYTVDGTNLNDLRRGAWSSARPSRSPFSEPQTPVRSGRASPARGAAQDFFSSRSPRRKELYEQGKVIRT